MESDPEQVDLREMKPDGWVEEAGDEDISFEQGDGMYDADIESDVEVDHQEEGPGGVDHGQGMADVVDEPTQLDIATGGDAPEASLESTEVTAESLSESKSDDEEAGSGPPLALRRSNRTRRAREMINYAKRGKPSIQRYPFYTTSRY